MKKILFGLFVILLLSFVSADVCPYGAEECDEYYIFIQEYAEDVDLSGIPTVFRFLLGEPEINVQVNMIDGTENVYGFVIEDDRITGFNQGGYEDASYIIIVDEEDLLELGESGDPEGDIEELYDSGEIVIEPQTFFGNVVGWFAGW